jgi:hypothetical protein
MQLRKISTSVLPVSKLSSEQRMSERIWTCLSQRLVLRYMSGSGCQVATRCERLFLDRNGRRSGVFRRHLPDGSMA